MSTKDTRRMAGDEKSGGLAKDRAVPENTNTVDRVIDDIRYIRDLVDTSRDFFVSGWSGMAAGMITIAGAAVSAWIISHPERWNISTSLWVLWVFIGILLLFSDGIFYARQARKMGRQVFSMLLLKVLLIETLMTAQGLILTLLFIRNSTPEYVPGAWLLTFGVTFTNTGLFIPGGFWILGLVTFAISIAAFIFPGVGLWCVGLSGAAMGLWGLIYLVTRGK
jgi:hypothetical protein